MCPCCLTNCVSACSCVLNTDMWIGCGSEIYPLLWDISSFLSGCIRWEKLPSWVPWWILMQIWIQLCSWESRLWGLWVSTWQLGCVFAWAVELEFQSLCSHRWPTAPNTGEIPLILPVDEMWECSKGTQLVDMFSLQKQHNAYQQRLWTNLSLFQRWPTVSLIFLATWWVACVCCTKTRTVVIAP